MKKKKVKERPIEGTRKRVRVPPDGKVVETVCLKISTIYRLGWICPVCTRGVNPGERMCPCGKHFETELTEGDLPPQLDVWTVRKED